MATHSSTLARRIPWTEEPGGLQSMGPPRKPYGKSKLRECSGKNCGQRGGKAFIINITVLIHCFDGSRAKVLADSQG